MEIDASYLLNLDSLINKVKTCGGTMVCVAGGAIRDMLLQKEVADIDVFFEGTLDDAIVHKIWPEAITKPETDYTNCKVLYDVTDSLFPVKVQLIQVENVPLHISEFPTSLSRVSYGQFAGLTGVDITFLVCVEVKELLFDKPVNMKYLCKMQEKFPDYLVKYSKPEYNPEMEEVPF